MTQNLYYSVDELVSMARYHNKDWGSSHSIEFSGSPLAFRG
jgi:hypothetical protein